MDRLLLKPDEAALMLVVGRSRLYQLLAQGELPSVKIGHSVRVPADALRLWVERHTRRPGLAAEGDLPRRLRLLAKKGREGR